MAKIGLGHIKSTFWRRAALIAVLPFATIAYLVALSFGLREALSGAWESFAESYRPLINLYTKFITTLWSKSWKLPE